MITVSHTGALRPVPHSEIRVGKNYAVNCTYLSLMNGVLALGEVEDIALSGNELVWIEFTDGLRIHRDDVVFSKAYLLEQ